MITVSASENGDLNKLPIPTHSLQSSTCSENYLAENILQSCQRYSDVFAACWLATTRLLAEHYALLRI